jgi:DNA processing protein
VNTAVTGDERIARATLTCIAEPGDPMTGALARAGGAARALEVIRSGTLAGITCLTATPGRRRALERLRGRLGQVPPPDVIGHWLEAGLRLVCPGDAEWPAGLDGLGDTAPAALWVTGQADLRFSCLRSVAVTGARAATAYGSYLASELSASLAARGWAVVSGASFGVDASAHRGALGAGGVTIAVTAGELNQPCPAAHAGLLDAIAAQGAVVSEAPPDAVASRLRFQARNRVIAALATGTVIVEAGTRSGALTVARHAHDLGRPVMAVPGPVTSDLSAGCNDLIRSGHAVLVTSASDVTDTLTAAARPAG